MGQSGAVNRVAELIASALLLVVILFPVFWLLLTSIKSVQETYQLPVSWWPEEINLEAYRQIWLSQGFSNDWVQYFLNTALVAFGVTIIVVLIGMVMGYSLSRLGNRWVPAALLILVLVQLFSGPSLIVPLHNLLANFGLLDTIVGYMFILAVFQLPFSALLSYNFANTIPFELDEAAKLDGCKQWQTFVFVILPLTKVGMVTIGLMNFLLIWGEYPFAVALLTSSENQTVSIALVELISGLNVYWNQMAAASVVISVPVILVLILAQKHLVRGLTSGAGK